MKKHCWHYDTEQGLLDNLLNGARYVCCYCNRPMKETRKGNPPGHGVFQPPVKEHGIDLSYEACEGPGVEGKGESEEAP